MHRAFQRALHQADKAAESAQYRPPGRKSPAPGERSLQEKLYDIYVEEYGREPEVMEELTRNVHLLEELVRRESWPHLVVNLLPGEEGYSLMIQGDSELCSETIPLPYEERDFLDYLDAEQLPPYLVDVLERSQVDVFQSGCVITEVRDYRQCPDEDGSPYQSRHVLLRPAMQMLASDIESIASANQKWTPEDRLSLDSQPILATDEPLCLDHPSVSAACIENKLLYSEEKMSTPAMQRNLEGCPAASLNPQQELPGSPPPPELRAGAPDQKSKERQPDLQDDLENFQKNCSDLWEPIPVDLDVPFGLDMDKYTRDWPFRYNEAQSIVWPDVEPEDDALFGRKPGDPSQTTRPTVMRSFNDPFISGIMSPGKVRRGRQMSHRYAYTHDHSYSIMPGSKTGAGKAARESKKRVKKTDRCAARVAQGFCGSASLSQPYPGRAVEQPQALSVQSAVQGQGGPHTPPAIRTPCSSGNSSFGKPFTSQLASRIRIRQLPSPAPASEPPSLPQKPVVEVKRVRTLPTATVTSASASQATPGVQVRASSDDSNLVPLMDCGERIVQTVVSGSNPIQSSPHRVRAPSGVKPSSLSSGGQPKSAGPAAPQAPFQGGVQYVLGNLSGRNPIRIIWVPHGSDISSILQQAQQQQQVLYPLISQPLEQQPPISHLLQPMVQISSVHGSSRQPRGLYIPQAAVINLNGAASVLQLQRAELSQPGYAQVRPGQRPSQQRVQLPVAFQKLPQSQWRVVQLPEAGAAASVQPAQPGGGQQTAGQVKGPENGGLSSTPKC